MAPRSIDNVIFIAGKMKFTMLNAKWLQFINHFIE